ncbi:hypothetical protein DXG01_001130 [Tephrocybe rancida]|nr:hypothetical protein DXG01_001130 [Tephrocybe rancida]
MSPPPQHTLETEIEHEMRLATEYKEMERQRDAQCIAGMFISRPAEPLFLAGTSAGRTLFLTSPEGERDLNNPVDDVAPCSSPGLIASASSRPSFGGVATNWELALVLQGLFFKAMQAVHVQDPP